MNDVEKIAFLMLANYYAFKSAEKIENPHVQSRMLLWCENGDGFVVVNGKEIALSRMDFLFLPWNHTIVYQASKKNPFVIGGCHIIPLLDKRSIIDYKIAHTREESLKYRFNRYNNDFKNEIISGNLIENKSLQLAAIYSVETFVANRKDSSLMEICANLLLKEISLVKEESSLPKNLTRAMEYVREKITGEIKVEEVANHIDVSVSTLNRIFKKYLLKTPLDWINHERVCIAKNLLSSSSLSVGEVGRQVGIEESYYFSRLFKKNTGLSPAEYRKKSPSLFINS